MINEKRPVRPPGVVRLTGKRRPAERRRRREAKPYREGIVPLEPADRPGPLDSADGFDVTNPPDDGNANITVSFHGGAIITQLSLELLFWGNAWSSPAVQPSSSQVVGALQELLSGPYMSGLGQYGIGPGSLRGSLIVQSDPPNPFSRDDWHGLIWDLIDQGTFPEPDDPGGRNLYLFVLPPGVGYDQPGVTGAHGYPGDYDFPFDYDTAWAGFVLNDGTLDTVTTRLSHELVEACTDPEDDGWTIDGRTSPTDEIGDVCQNTTGRVGQVMVQGYWSQRDRACLIPTGTLVLGGVSGAPTLIQSKFGNRGNFEVVTPMASGGLAHYWRNNDDPWMPWNGPSRFGQGTGQYDAVALIQSNYGDPGNLEVVARAGDQLVSFWRESAPDFAWHGPFPIVADGEPVTGVAGLPALIQSRFGTQGNFEVVVPMADRGLGHFWRDNDDPAMPWHGPDRFGQSTSIASLASASLIESNYGSPGNFEVVAGVGITMEYFWRDSGPGFAWTGPSPIQEGVGTMPVLIQGTFGNQGNFELIAGAPSFGPDSGLYHYWRDNDDPALPWRFMAEFGIDPSRSSPIAAVTFIQSNYGNPGHLEVIVRVADQLIAFWRDSGPSFQWNGPIPITAGS